MRQAILVQKTDFHLPRTISLYSFLTFKSYLAILIMLGGLWAAVFLGCSTPRKGRIFMVKELVHDPILLARKSQTATPADLDTARDLMDTLLHHRETCVGMAANMIGVTKNIIAFQDGKDYCLMLNPEILRKAEPYETEESCLSLLGGPRTCTRYNKIKVRWQTEKFQVRLKTFEGWTAQIIQHEIDHCNGVLI